MLVQFTSYYDASNPTSNNVDPEVMLKYISERPGVEKYNEEDIRQATYKQINKVDEFINKYPELKQLPEYLNYIENKTLINASLFLSEASHNLLSNMDSQEKMLKYISERPGVEKFSYTINHGLFNQNGIADLDNELEAIREAKENGAIIWTSIYSLKREDAIIHDLNSRNDWEELLKVKMHKIASNHNISFNKLKWNAAFHDEGHHPHVHVQFYSTDANEGRLSKTKTIDVLEKNRLSLSKQIFKESFKQQRELYQEVQNELTEFFSKKLLSNKSEQLYLTDEQELLISNIKKDIEKINGRKYYAYLPFPLKNQVDVLLDSLLVNQGKECLKKYIDVQTEYYRLYIKDENKVNEMVNKSLDQLIHPSKSTEYHNQLLRTFILNDSKYNVINDESLHSIYLEKSNDAYFEDYNNLMSLEDDLSNDDLNKVMNEKMLLDKYNQKLTLNKDDLNFQSSAMESENKVHTQPINNSLFCILRMFVRGGENGEYQANMQKMRNERFDRWARIKAKQKKEKQIEL